MEIISHRGLWYGIEEKNTENSFITSYKNNFGTETDIRDYKSDLVISHDIATSNSFDLEKLFTIYSNSDLTLALNIKSDGLHDLLKEKIQKFNIKKYFIFDMSIPDTLNYLKLEMNVLVRLSEYESESSLVDKAAGVWVDSFNDIWYNEKLIYKYLDKGKIVCLVSPELHKRDKYELWEKLKKMKINNNNLVLCTDLPLEASNYFNLNI